MSYLQTNQPINLRNAAAPANDLLVSDTGKIMFIPALTTATRVINLPAPLPGLHYRFMASNVLGQIARITATGGTTLNGVVLNNNAGAATAVQIAGVKADFTATAVLGDYLDVYSDGTLWYCSGASSVAAGLSA